MSSSAGDHRGYATAIILHRRAFATNAWPPAMRSIAPRVGDDRSVAVQAGVVSIALDQHTFTGCASCHEEKHGPRDGRRFKKATGLIERRARLEGDAQGMLGGRTAAGEEGRERVQCVVEPQQP